MLFPSLPPSVLVGFRATLSFGQFTPFDFHARHPAFALAQRLESHGHILGRFLPLAVEVSARFAQVVFR
jgi:hypothetical protein